MSNEIIPIVPSVIGNIRLFSDGLYRAGCMGCGHAIQWSVHFDADGSVYYARCCEHEYRMRTYEVIITVDE